MSLQAGGLNTDKNFSLFSDYLRLDADVTIADACLLDEWTNNPKNKVWDLPEGFSHSPSLPYRDPNLS